MKKSILTMALVCISFVSFAQDKDDQRVIADAEKAKIKLQSGNYGLDQW